ncbi:hypothetical protein [Novosphingobium sp.]|uniref:hypothetical protein n=1 Tax=Novosphingobium sp. TaxID=1874826 RepID=UPI00273578BC|nr:hypothetical protein [Novosphingobium sp.]MDP3908467.1 hypothetical protein [Novosphingobium sp.]
MKNYIIMAMAAPLVLGACSSTGSSSMDVGQRISERGSTIGSYGAAWSDGQRDVKQGQRLIDKGSSSSINAEKQLARARADMIKAEEQLRKAQVAKAEGERLIADGTAQMQQAESAYTAVRVGPPAVGTDPRN